MYMLAQIITAWYTVQGPHGEELDQKAGSSNDGSSSRSDWSHALPASFNIRGKDYLVTKQKQSCAEAAIYRSANQPEVAQQPQSTYPQLLQSRSEICIGMIAQ